MYRAVVCLSEQHTAWVLPLCTLVCWVSCHAALRLLDHSREGGAREGPAWLLAAGFSLGAGIWSTHFIAMLGYDPGVGVGYDLPATLLSFAAAIAAALGALSIMRYAGGPASAAAAGCLLGLGGAAAHFTGMAGLRVPGTFSWDVPLVLAAVGTGGALACGGFFALARPATSHPRLVAATLLTAAITALHFLSMAAAELAPDPRLGIAARDGVQAVLAAAGDAGGTGGGTGGVPRAALALGIAASMLAILAFAAMGLFAGRLRRSNRALAERETALQEQAALLGVTLDTMDQGLVMIDAHGTIAVANRRTAELLGLDPAFLARKPHYTELRRVQAEAGEYGPSGADFQAWVTGGSLEAPQAVYERTRPNGMVLEVRNVVLPGGGALRTYTDVTARRQAERVLQEKTALLDATLESMDQGLMMVDAEGVVRVCNERAIALLALPAEMMRSQPRFEAVRLWQLGQQDFAKSNDAMRQWVADSGMDRDAHVYERERPNGTVLEIRTVPRPDGSAVRTYTDVTARRQAERRTTESEERLRALTDALPQMVWVARASDGVTVYANQRFQQCFGAADTTRGQRIGAHHPDDRDRAAREWAAAQAEERTFETEARWRSTGSGADSEDGADDGRAAEDAYRWHKVVIAPVRHGGAVVEWLGTALDIDDIVAAREALRLSEERLALALEAGSDGLWDTDLATGEQWSSDRWWRMLGYEPGEMAVDGRTWRGMVHPDDLPRAARLVEDHKQGRSPVFECELRLRRKDGSWGWVLTRGKVVARAQDGTPLRMVGTHVDIGARKEAEARIVHMARHDALTDLPNRTLFRDQLDRRLAEIAGDCATGSPVGGPVSGQSCAVLCLDLDRFKEVNDTLGHLAGDALLREVAQRLRGLLRAEDTVARLGGDEFAILLGAGDPERAPALAERLIAAVQAPVLVGGQQVDVGVSVGVALVPEHGTDAETVLKRADLALYRAKAEGRNAARVFEPAMDREAAELRGLERDLRHAIQASASTDGGAYGGADGVPAGAGAGQLSLHYQPQVSARTGDLVGFEALVRWHHPTRGLVSPVTFIPVAEQTGLIAPLGEWVLREACREAARWTGPLKVAVNLSARQFQQPDLFETVLGILAETGLAPARLELEITESVIVNDMGRAQAVLRRLKALGIRIAMDDFGTGHSSLATLQAFPFDKIKIDRQFVGAMEADPQASVIVCAVLGLGRSLGMGVVAEGVETADQMRLLVREACDEVQGYFFGKPQPIERFAEAVYAEPAEWCGPEWRPDAADAAHAAARGGGHRIGKAA